MTAKIREVYCVLHMYRSGTEKGCGGFHRVATFIKKENAEAFLGKVMRASQQGFEEMAQALKTRAESLVP